MKSKFIAMVTMSLWDEPHRGRHHFATALSENHKVLWVNRQKRTNEPGTPKIGIEKISQNLNVLHTGRNLLHERVDGRLNFNNGLRLRRIISALNQYGIPDIVWIYDYRAQKIAKYFYKKATVLYFCNDNFGERAYCLYEPKLVAYTDYVFATSPKLAERLKHYSENCHFLPHGIWPAKVKPFYRKELHPKTAGYVGVLQNNLDFVFLERLVVETDIQLHLAGPVFQCELQIANVNKLLTNPKVVYHGNLDTKKVQELLREIDICLLPYLIEREDAQYGFRLKYFDYLNAGKPIVATPYFDWPAPYKQFVNVYNGTADLRDFLQKTYSNWSKSQFDNAIELASISTWKKRIEKVGQIIRIDL